MDGKWNSQFEGSFPFDNNVSQSDVGLIWDIDHLVNMVKEGIKKCGDEGIIPETVAIDTWGVDYVLLDKDGKEILPFYAYRNSRTKEVIPEIEKTVSFDELYEHTGLQKQEFNTIYQLYHDKVSGRLEKAESFLFLPSYLSYKLTGIAKNEYTDASTSALLDVRKKDWDFEIIDKLGLPRHLFKTIYLPGEVVGEFSKEIQEEIGFNSKVILCASHDTASAVVACPLQKDGMFVSSGTWSLAGMEMEEPVVTNDSKIVNFSNEGGIQYRYRFLKNYMGMWLMQNIRRNINKSLTYDEMMNLAMETKDFSFIDVNDDSFVAPECMVTAIKEYLGKPDMPLGEVINSVYHSLAKSYVMAVKEIENITGKTVSAISIVGGGSRDTYLNQLTAEYSKKKVLAGPVEATALGNIGVQLMHFDPSLTLEELREIIKKSFSITETVGKN
ncbi:MAG: rhamnulokinase [Clostridia bacterium]|nr:rhamnulokinase [Clostridia bacterium]